MKICSRCKVEKDVKEFYKNAYHASGLCYWCKTCHNGHINGVKHGKIKKKEREIVVPKGVDYLGRPKKSVDEKFSTFMDGLRQQGKVLNTV